MPDVRGPKSNHLLIQNVGQPSMEPSMVDGGEIVAIGASTGGPGAIIKLLGKIPISFVPPIVIVQHIQASFLEGFVQWLNSELKREVLIAEQGSVVLPQKVYVASTSGNLSISPSNRFTYAPALKDQIYVPSIDYFFHSLSERPSRGSAILLSGMGEDGAAGLKLLSERAWSTFIQAPSSCIVAGMPCAAQRLSPRHHLDIPEHIGDFLRTFELSRNRKDSGKAKTNYTNNK